MSKFSEMFSFKKDPSKSPEENINDNQNRFEKLPADEQNDVIVRDKTNAERIERTRNQKYDNRLEYKVDPENPEVREKIQEAQELYRKFAEEFETKLDLGNPESIDLAYARAEELGMMEKAQEMREFLFGKDMNFYGVAYTCDYCNNNCAYCPFSAMKKEAVENKQNGNAKPEYPYRALNEKQVLQETLAVMEQGHTHICFLEGSPSKETIKNGNYAKKISKFVTEVITGTSANGLKEIILNIEPLTEEGFKMVAEAAKEANEKNGTNVSLQFRVFQETYNKDVYLKNHATIPPLARHVDHNESDEEYAARLQKKIDNMAKADYDERIGSQARALNAGFDNVGLGALFNLNAHPIDEIQGLLGHVEKLRQDFGKGPVRICLPSANELANFKVDIGHQLKPGEERLENGKLGKFKYGTYERLNELLYVMARLAMPDINIVSSERDTPEMLRILNKYATCTTLGVKTHTGENSGIPVEEMANKGALEKHQKYEKEQTEKKVIGQATTFPREVEPTLKEMVDDGWNPVLEGKTELIEALKIEKVREKIQEEN